MGCSNCLKLFCNNETNIEYTTPCNQPTSNNEYPKINQNNSNDFNSKDEYSKEKGINLCKELNPNIDESIHDISNNQNKDIKSFINILNIRKISFPFDKNKLNENSTLLFEKIEKILSRFYPCDEKELKNIELYLNNILINLKNNLNGNVIENKPILSGKLQQLINFSNYGCKTRKKSERFCVLYNNVFKYYKSEIQYLKGLKPLNIIYLNQIARINMVKLDINSTKLNNIMICNKFPIEKEENKYQNFEINEINDIFKDHSNESIIIFSSDNENSYTVRAAGELGPVEELETESGKNKSGFIDINLILLILLSLF